jgi:shikimate kinase
MTPTFRTLQGVSAVDSAVPHLILIGLPGCGKSVVGMRAAEISGRSFLDFDTEIERREGMTIAQIFAERGEYTFRQLERTLTEELRELGGMILAPGGGWITNADVVSMLRPPGRLVYLDVKPETALRRMGKRKELRPLLRRPDPLKEIRDLYQARHVLYEGADVVISSEASPLQAVTERVVALAKELR